MASSVAFNTFKSSAVVSWKSTGMLQKTLRKCIEKYGIGLHSGKWTKVKLWPELAGKGRHFEIGSNRIQASIDFVQESPLCTTLCKDGLMVRTVEHLLSALEATGVDNCRIEITPSDQNDRIVEVPILDGSARDWMEAIEQAGLEDAPDENGNGCEKMAPFVNMPVHLRRNDSFIAAFPSPEVHITYGINFPEVPSIGYQWFCSSVLNRSFYATDIASSRTFCVYEEVEQMREMGFIKGGSLENAIVYSVSKGCLNLPLRFSDEPCRHKVLDLIGDLSLFANSGNQGLPVAHIVAYKENDSRWIDSRATRHVCNNESILKTFVEIEDGPILYLENSSTIVAKGKGQEELEFTFKKILTLNDVLFVPKVRKHLTFGSLLNKHYFKMAFEVDKFVLSKSDICWTKLSL